MKIAIIIILVIVVLLVLFLYIVKPHNQKKNDWKPVQNHLYAHRGLYDPENKIPENSMAAFKRAVEAGYGIELDVQLTKDNIPVVMHDFTLKRMCGVEGKVYEYTYAELQQFTLDGTDEKIPLFEDFLKLVDGKVPLVIEYKVEATDASVCPIANDILKDYKGKYVIESFNPMALHWYRKNRKDIIRGQLSMKFKKEEGYKGPLYFLLTNLMLNVLTRPDFIAYNHEDSKNSCFRIATKLFKAKPVAWTIRSQAELDGAKKDFDIFIFEKFIPNDESIKEII